MAKLILLRGFLVLTSMGLMGCSLQDTADSLEESTKNIEENSGHLSEQSDQIAERTEELLKGMRKVESLNTLSKAREELIASKGTTLKIQKAMVFFAAFEFQEWTGKYTDTPKHLDDLYSLAVKLFFTSVDDLIDDQFPVNPWKPNNNWLSVASLAVSMSYQESKQEEAVKGHEGLEPVSMYSLIAKALEMEPLVNQGKPVPQYVHRVLEWKQEAIYLLQLRHNYFAAMVLARMTPFEESSLFQLKQRFWGSSIQLNQFSVSQFKEWSGWLKDARETQRLLGILKIKLQFTDCIQSSFSNLKMESGDLSSKAEIEFLKQFVIYTSIPLN